MKFNQWTLGLAAVGVISFASAARAEETAVPLMTALSATTISGYVDTSLEWTLDRTTGGYSYMDSGNSSEFRFLGSRAVQHRFKAGRLQSERRQTDHREGAG